MQTYTQLKSLFTKVTGFHLYRDNPPWGVSLEKDLPRLSPNFRPGTIFDVGANVGQTADRFLQMYPDAVIHCFEPVSGTFKLLTNRHVAHRNVKCHQLALSDHSGTASINVYSTNEICSLEPDLGRATSHETVTVETIDAFTARENIPSIDFLKIDAEGHDLSVLKGAEKVLKSGNTKFVFVEIQLSRYKSNRNRGTKPVSLMEIADYLEPLGYRCLGIYDQDFVPYWALHFGNALFAPIKDFP